MLPDVSMEVGIVADPELRFSAAGKAFAKFRAVAKDRKRDASGAWSDGDAHFLDVICFGRIAENVCESLRKGDTAIVLGRLQIREYESNGVKGKAVEVAASAVGNSLTWNPAPSSRPEKSTPAPAATDEWNTDSGATAPF
jgi:single-strand DNA-binding protein